ncbi:hypothetical protein ADEAN_000537800 [Angomonas deanei]|uniref:Uncharacterized protein n=1 Tax=Angomonas deanei TaxID=59799 RepID=A0A7G2CI43_9TRYP|nr:hypothetical protein ADEAN_000537800 [Angomonas deanei]
MFRRSALFAVQRSPLLLNKSAAAPKVVPKTAPKTAKGPVMTETKGAGGPPSDSIVDKVVLLGAVGAFFAWFTLVPGPHNQH